MGNIICDLPKDMQKKIMAMAKECEGKTYEEKTKVATEIQEIIMKWKTTLDNNSQFLP